MASYRELAISYILRIAVSADPHAECRIIAREINNLIFVESRKPISLEDKLEIATLITEIPREIRKGGLGYDSGLGKVASSNTDFNEFTQEIISFLGGQK